jgi:hypothetical protein
MDMLLSPRKLLESAPTPHEDVAASLLDSHGDEFSNLMIGRPDTLIATDNEWHWGI